MENVEIAKMVVKIKWKDPARADRLTQLVAEAKTGSEIASILSEEWKIRVTRNVVIGAAARLDLRWLNYENKKSQTDYGYKKGAQRLASGTDARALAGKLRMQRARNNKAVNPVKLGEPPQPKSLSEFDAAIPLDQRKQMYQLREADVRRHKFGDCHWPVGDPQAKNFFYCGGEASGSYCAFHASVATAPRRTQRMPSRGGLNWGR